MTEVIPTIDAVIAVYKQSATDAQQLIADSVTTPERSAVLYTYMVGRASGYEDGFALGVSQPIREQPCE